MRKTTKYLRTLVGISEQLDKESAMESIRNNIDFKGANVAILACAIVLASVGLNVNSIPVIIGAMLVSPVMGPIIGIGLGMGTYDTSLLKASARNLLVMVLISILTATLFFLISPLRPENPTELLARTNPTIYDVLIALFGGFAGIIEISRKEKGTVISGVAIATALMPPLCTVGYGLARFDWHYISGALYLFTINSVFIALATFIVVRYLHFSPAHENDPKQAKLARRGISILTVLVLIPSIITAADIVRQTNFSHNASKVVNRNKTIGRSYIFDHKIDAVSKPRTLEIFFAGDALSPEGLAALYADAEGHGISREQIIIRDEAAFSRDDMPHDELFKNIYDRNEEKVRLLNSSIDSLGNILERYRSKDIPSRQIMEELCTQYEGISNLVIARGNSAAVRGIAPSDSLADQVVVLVSTLEPMDEGTCKRLENWLKVRLGGADVKLLNVK